MKYRIASDQVIDKILDDEAVIINLATGIYYGLDGPSAKVWDYVSKGVSRERIARQLAVHFPNESNIEQSVTRLIDQMCQAELLAPDGEKAEEESSVALEWPAVFLPLEMTCYDDVADMVALDPPLPELSHEMIDQPRAAEA